MTVEIELTQGFVAVVDDLDADLANVKWTARRSSLTEKLVYAIRKNPERIPQSLTLHRVVLARVLERPLADFEFCDHINGNGLDNRRFNLRLATPTQNMRNKRLSSANTTGLKGVSLHKASCKYQSHIRVNKKLIHLGLFVTAEEAHEAYKQAAIRYFGEFRRTE